MDDVFGQCAIEMMLAQKCIIPVGDTGYRLLFTHNAISNTWTCTTTDEFMTECQNSLHIDTHTGD